MKNIEINERMNERDTVASIGIGAMIVFIALILVAAVASAVIIQTGEKLQQNAQKTGSDTQQEIGGKISVIAAWVGDQTATTEDVTVIFETAAGSEPITAVSIGWTIVCADIAGTDTDTVGGTFAAATDLDAVTAAGTTTAPFTQGNVYMIDLLVGTTNAWATPSTDECVPVAGEEHILIIMVNGGGTTYETLSYNSVDEGASIV